METKKYIIEIPDNTAWLQWVNVSDKDGHVYFDFKDPEDLTPYTEPDPEAIKQEAYEKGLSDAWDAARKIYLDVNKGGLSVNALTIIFGNKSTNQILKELSVFEAIEKIRQYEQEQKEIKVWDEVRHKSCNKIKIVVLNKESDAITGIAIEDVPYACKVGEMYINRNEKDWEKTGKHYDIAEVLRKMKEKEA